MGKTLLSDIPGYKDRISHVFASFASDLASNAYYPLHTVGRESTFTGAYWIPSANQSAAGSTNYRTMQIINIGSDGTGTTVLGSKVLSAAAGAGVRQAFSLGAAANLGLSDADVIALRFLKAGDGAVTTGGGFQVEYT